MTDNERKHLYDEIKSLQTELAQARFQLQERNLRDRQSPDVRAVYRLADAIREMCKSQVVEVEGSKYWVFALNRYQRDNLLWLFAAVGTCEGPNGFEGVAPYGFLNTGDWAGEIAGMLAAEGLTEDDHPNKSLAELARDIEWWLKEKTK